MRVSFMVIFWLVLGASPWIFQVSTEYTALYERCSIPKGQRSNFQPQAYYDCQFTRVSPKYFQNQLFLCSDHCPPSPEGIRISLYKHPVTLNGPNYTGVNMSWAINATLQKFQRTIQYLDGFRLELNSAKGYKIMFMNLTNKHNSTLPVIDDNGMMRFHFDCFFPLKKNTIWSVSVVRLPHDNWTTTSNEISTQFTVDENGDLIGRERMPTAINVPNGLSPTKGSVLSDIDTTFHYKPGENMATPKPLQILESISRVNQIRNSMIGVIIGVICGILILVCGGILTYWYYKRKERSADGECSQGKRRTQSPDKNSQNNQAVKTLEYNKPGHTTEKLVLLYAEHSNERTERVQCDLTVSLAKICHVIDLWNIKNKDGYDLRDLLVQEFKTACTIVIVSSDRVVNVWRKLHGGWPPSDGVIEIALHTLMNMENDLCSKVVTVYFPEDLEVIQGFSQWFSVLLPENLNDLHGFVQNKMSHNVDLVEQPIDEVNRQSKKTVYIISQNHGQISLSSSKEQVFHSNISTTGNCGTTVYDSGFNETDWNTPHEPPISEGQLYEAKQPCNNNYHNNVPHYLHGPTTLPNIYDSNYQMYDKCTHHDIHEDCKRQRCNATCNGNVVSKNTVSHVPRKNSSCLSTDYGSDVEDINNDYDSIC